jgi:hypothetical protein
VRGAVGLSHDWNGVNVNPNFANSLAVCPRGHSMLRPRLTIATAMIVVLVTALALAALRSPTRWWASILFSLEVTALSVAAVVGLTQRGARQGACAGMVVFGFLYLHYAFADVDRPPLITNALVEILADRLYAPLVWESRSGGSPTPPGRFRQFTVFEDSATRPNNSPNWVHIDVLTYRQIGHLCIAPLAGAVGAALGTALSRRGRASGRDAAS